MLMKSAKRVLPIVAASAICFAALPIKAQNVTQTITLQPGWNAIWIEVQPTNNRASAVFSNLPIVSVGTRA